jgi:hypothetical protein
MSLIEIYKQQGVDEVCKVLKMKKHSQYDIDDLLTSCSYNVEDFIKINELGYSFSINYEKNIGTMASANMLTTFGMYDYIKNLYDRGFRYKDESQAMVWCSECVPVDTRVLKLLLCHHYNGKNDLVNPFINFIRNRNLICIQILIDHGIECDEFVALITMLSNMDIFSIMHHQYDLLKYRNVFLDNIYDILRFSDFKLFMHLITCFQPDQDIINNLHNFIGTTDRVIHQNEVIKINFLLNNYPPDEDALLLDLFNSITKRRYKQHGYVMIRLLTIKKVIKIDTYFDH